MNNPLKLMTAVLCGTALFLTSETVVATPNKSSIEKLVSLNNTCDIIILRNGQEIQAKVLEVGQTEIKYKNCDNLEGPTFSKNKSEVFMIRYPNGTSTVMEDTKPPSTNNNTPYDLLLSSDQSNEPKNINKHPKWNISAGIGGALPFANYADVDALNARAGFALDGLAVNLQVSYQFHEKIGAYAKFFRMVNNVDADGLAHYGITVISDPLPYHLVAGNVLGLTTTKFGKSGKSFFQPKIGVMFGSYYAPEYDYFFMGGLHEIRRVNKKTSASGLHFGMSGGYRLGKSFSINAGIDGIFAISEPKMIGYSPSFPNGDRYTVERGISTLNLTIGVGFLF